MMIEAKPPKPSMKKGHRPRLNVRGLRLCTVGQSSAAVRHSDSYHGLCQLPLQFHVEKHLPWTFLSITSSLNAQGHKGNRSQQEQKQEPQLPP